MLNYDDTALTPDLFQWDTRNRVKPDSKEGKAYIEKEYTMLPFVREQNTFPEDKYIRKMLEPIPGSVMHYARIKEIA